MEACLADGSGSTSLTLDTFMVSGILLRVLSTATMEASRHGRMCPVKTQDKATEFSRLSSKMPEQGCQRSLGPEKVYAAHKSLVPPFCAPRFPFSRGAAEGMGAEHRPGDLSPKQHTVICSEHFPARSASAPPEPQEPQAQRSAYSVRLPGPRHRCMAVGAPNWKWGGHCCHLRGQQRLKLSGP